MHVHQGYYFYRPLTVGKMEDLLEHRPDDQHFWNISKDLMHRDYRMSTNGPQHARIVVIVGAYF